MKIKNHFLLFFICLGVCLCTQVFGQNTIQGIVKDVNGNPLIGANVLIQGTSQGTVTDLDGNFSITSSENFPFTLAISYTGYTDKNIEVTSNAPIEVALAEGILADEVVVSASRKREKVQEAPASVSIISARELSVSANTNPVENLSNLRGVQVQQQSANRLNIEMRGWANVFSTSVFPLVDYRNVSIPGVGTWFSNGSGLSNLDMRTIEVVRGPGSALYGPGVTSGVVHFLTKNPITYPGTAIEVAAGELSTFNIAARHATKVSDKFGFKVNAMYQSGTDFNYDPRDTDDAPILEGFGLKNIIISPAFDKNDVPINPVFDPMGNLIDANGGSIVVENADADGDGNPLDPEYRNMSFNTTLEFRPQDDWSIFASAGYNSYNNILHSASTGPTDSYNEEVWTQLRTQYKGLFAQINYSDINGTNSRGTAAVYSTGLVATADRGFFDSQIQYNFQVPSLLNADVTIGGDYRSIKTDSYRLLHGRNEGADDMSLYGLYLQSKFQVSDKLDILGAIRFDGNNFLDETTLAPRVAMVFKPNKNHTVRASYNRAVSPPGALVLFVDLPINSLPFGNIWAYKAADGTNFNEINLLQPGAPNIPIETPALPTPLAAIHGLINGPTVDALIANGVPAPITDFLASYVPQGVANGTLIPYHISELGVAVSQGANAVTNIGVPQGTSPVKNEFNDVYELGYSGKFAGKFKLDLDLYYIKRKGFTRPRVLGALYGMDGIGAALMEDISQALQTTFMLPEADANQIAGAYLVGGNRATGLVGVADGDGVPQDPAFNIPFSWDTFDESIDYYGADLGLTYGFTKEFSAYFNYSWVSQNSWVPGESNDDGLTSRFDINTPENKFRIGVKYISETGLNGSIAFRHNPSFYFDGGQFYSGQSDEQNIIDANVGYQFSGNAEGLGVSLSAINLLNNEYRAAPNFPKIGRRIMAKVTYAFGMKNN